MQQVISIWLALNMQRRIVVIASTLIMFAAIAGLARMATTPTLTLLYSGLDSSAAGEVVQTLEQQGVNYEIRRGAIFVESSRRDELRMTLAAEGLPASNGQGYELLDALTGFGTTSQMFDATYWRALEGELARTIISSPLVQTARVHISKTTAQSLRRVNKATASVTVTGSGGGFPTAHARALKYMVASAVSGLSPDDVSIIDGKNGVVISGDEPGTSTSTTDDREAKLKENIERLLEARVGFGNAIVEVNVETVTQSETIIERRFDPEGRVAISTDTEERTTSSSDSGNGSVSVASNLPNGDAGGGDSNSNSQNSETRERINFEVSETTRELLRVPGAVKRLSIAVLLDGIDVENPTTGETEWAPRSEDELASLEALVKSAIGFDKERGDTLTLKSLEFEPVIAQGSIASPSVIQKLNLDIMNIVQIIVLAVVTLVLGLFVFRPIFMRPPTFPVPELPGPGVPSTSSTAQMGTNSGVLTGEIADDSFVPNTIEANPAQGGGGSSIDENPVQRLKQLITERQDETVDVIRTWMENDEERTS